MHVRAPTKLEEAPRTKAQCLDTLIPVLYYQGITLRRGSIAGKLQVGNSFLQEFNPTNQHPENSIEKWGYTTAMS